MIEHWDVAAVVQTVVRALKVDNALELQVLHVELLFSARSVFRAHEDGQSRKRGTAQ
ncbi:hypothetical protein [Shewanella sp. UCD-KL21]|uniref:hypothetical protein n=1 Tax=Shewanella sp. UCD-KL21 TaxID=1917164 RepID=UPI00158E3CF1|nr:hypothetical protein [Shewanella sp. UCD-KL21]